MHGVVWIGSGASIPPDTPKRHIYGCTGQDVGVPGHPLNYIHHRLCPNPRRRSSNVPSTSTSTPLRARASLVTSPRVWSDAVAPVTIAEQVCRSPFVKNYYYLPKVATLEEFDNCLYARSLVMTYGTSSPA